MRKFLSWLGAAIGVVTALVLLAPLVLPASTVQSWVEAEVERATGRRLAIGDEFSISVFPRIEARARAVRLASAPGMSIPNLLDIDELRLGLELWPLLSGRVVVTELALIRPVFAFEIAADGRRSWDFSPTRATAPANPPSRGGAPLPAGLALSDIEIGDGRVVFIDRRSGSMYQASGLDLVVSAPTIDGPLRAEGALVWNDRRLDVRVDVGRLLDLRESRATALSVRLGGPLTVDYHGTLDTAAETIAKGRLVARAASLRDIAGWVGAPIDASLTGLEAVALEGDLAIADNAVSLDKVSLALDRLRASGDLRVATGGVRPVVSGRLDVDRFDLAAYRAPGAPPAGSPARQARRGWSTAPIRVPALDAVDLDLGLGLGALAVDAFRTGPITATIALASGRLVAEVREASLYGGRADARLALDSTGASPAIELRASLAGVDAHQLLRDAAGVEDLEGTASGTVQLATAGASEAALVGRLGGQGRVSIVNGAVRGVDLFAMARNVAAAFSGGPSPTARTTFSQLAGSFRIVNGVVTNNDLVMTSAPMSFEGNGTVNLPSRTLDYRIDPKILGSAQARGRSDALLGVNIPILVRGSLDDPTFAPGLELGVPSLPGKALETIERVIPREVNPVDPLRRLFGR